MKKNNFSEKESLQLISQMLKQTKRNMAIGSGNIFLYYGYSAFVISILVFSLIHLTANPAWTLLWFLMFIPNIFIKIKNAKEKPSVTTYMDKAIENVWAVVGALFALTIIAIVIFGRQTDTYKFMLMLPLSLLYAGIGTSITGVITKIKALIYMPLIAFSVSIYMLIGLISNETTILWHLYFGITFVFMMIIPGHMINRKAQQQCLKN